MRHYCVWGELHEVAIHILPKTLLIRAAALTLIHQYQQQEVFRMNEAVHQAMQDGGFASSLCPTQQDGSRLLTPTCPVFLQKLHQILYDLI